MKSHRSILLLAILWTSALSAQDEVRSPTPCGQSSSVAGSTSAEAQTKLLAPLPAVEQALRDLSAKRRLEMLFEHRHGSLVVGYKTQRLMIHGRSKIGEISKQPHEEIGPSYEGLLLWVHVMPADEFGQAIRPQEVQEPYWRTYLGETGTNVRNKRLDFSLSYGVATDRELIKDIRDVLAKAAGGEEKSLRARPGER